MTIHRHIKKEDAGRTLSLQSWGQSHPMCAAPIERLIREVSMHTFETFEPSWDDEEKDPWCLRQSANWRVEESDEI